MTSRSLHTAYDITAIRKQMREVRLPITGLAGPPCADRVERALMAIVGVASALVNMKRGRATVVYDPTRARLSALEGAVRRVGCGVVRSARVVLRLGMVRTSTAEDDASSAAWETTTSGGILQELITTALERAGASDPPLDMSCPLAPGRIRHA